MFVELFLFLFVIIVFITVAIGFSKKDPEPFYASPDSDVIEIQPSKKKKSFKSVSFSEVVTERVFGKNGVASNDNIIQINDIPK